MIACSYEPSEARILRNISRPLVVTNKSSKSDKRSDPLGPSCERKTLRQTAFGLPKSWFEIPGHRTPKKVKQNAAGHEQHGHCDQ